MEINPSNVLQRDAISLLNEAFSYPRWARHRDVRPFTRLPAQRPGRPRHDLVDALRGHLFYWAGIDAAGSESKLIRHAALAWDLDLETVGKQLRAYAKGEVCPSKGKQSQLARLLPSIKSLVEWPWEALYFRRFKEEPAEFDQWRNKRSGLEVDAFWKALIAFRDSIDGGDVECLARSARQLICALDVLMRHPMIASRKIEMLDLVSRILHALPPFLMPKCFSLSFVLDGSLTEAEKRAVLLIDDEDWESHSIFIRYLAAVVALGNQGDNSMDVKRKAWDFMPSVQEQNRQFDDGPLLGMFSDDGFDVPGCEASFKEVEQGA